MANEYIRRAARAQGVRLWELADKFGVTDNYFSRRLRHEFNDKDTQMALKYIDEIAAERDV